MSGPFGDAPFLTDIPLETARARLEAALDDAGVGNHDVEWVALDDALDRVTALPVFARLSSPQYHACAMDGIAVAAAATRGASETKPLLLRLESDAFVVDTGDPLPPRTDAVIMVEDLEPHGDGRVAIRRYVPDSRVALIAFAQREQGLIVAPGNPLRLRSLRDVVIQRARYVNRQRDAGTRMLLDALLARDGFAPADIEGYDRLEFTHLAVAALVADCGLGIDAAARALGCDFVPLATEPYELAANAAALDDPRIAALIAAMRDPALRAAIEALGGYDATQAGDVRIVETFAAAVS
jgi:molybdate-binding protein